MPVTLYVGPLDCGCFSGAGFCPIGQKNHDDCDAAEAKWMETKSNEDYRVFLEVLGRLHDHQYEQIHKMQAEGRSPETMVI